MLKLVQKKRLLPFNPNIMTFVKKLRKQMTKEEKKLWYNFLRNHEYKFIRQKPIDNYIVDFYCFKALLAIEIDGSHHFENDYLGYDKIRSEILDVYGVRVVRFTNADVNNSFDEVCNEINKILPPQSR